MKKSLKLLKEEFESSCQRTTQYLTFHRTFKRELTNLLKEYCNKIEIGKPNHFDVSGFFELKTGQIYYFMLGDLRWFKNSILIRTATNFKDYTGGSNNFINLDEEFEQSILKYLKLK